MSLRWGWIFVFLWWCEGCQQVEKQPLPKNENSNESLTIKVFRVNKEGWGYQILREGKTLINQPFIPAIEGKIPFADSVKASHTAQLVVNKLQNNIIPPALSKQELDSLGVIPPESALTDKP